MSNDNLKDEKGVYDGAVNVYSVDDQQHGRDAGHYDDDHLASTHVGEHGTRRELVSPTTISH